MEFAIDKGGIAVRQIDRGDADAGGESFNVAGLIVVFIVRQAADHVLYRAFRQNSDAVEVFLPMNFDVVAAVFNLHPGKSLVGGLEFLQKRHIGLELVQPFEHAGQAGADGVYVPGRDDGQCSVRPLS